MLTDMYQLTMCYAYWKADRHNLNSNFELFFRKPPFGGEITVMAGLDQVLSFLHNFNFTPSDITYIKKLLPSASPSFFTYLSSLDCSSVTVSAIPQGSLVFPRIPLITISGPLGICQLLETTLLTLINYPSLVTTNAARFRIAAGDDKVLLEFGLRRAQGPDGGFSASKYCIIGGFDGTSNVIAGKLLGEDVKVKGTHAHAFVQSFKGLEEVVFEEGTGGEKIKKSTLKYRRELHWEDTHEGELAAFISYADAFPSQFLALIDTYDTLGSGLKNFILVALALDDAGFKPAGIRLDSGDLAYFSSEVRKAFTKMSNQFDRDFFHKLMIVASNDINENVLQELKKQEHAITAFGIGTNLVTCQKQPALGCVYKLVEIEDQPKIKISQDIAKVLIPGRKHSYRLFGGDGSPILDLLIRENEPPPKVGERFLCRHPFEEQKRVFVTPSRVEKLSSLVWDGKNGVVGGMPTISASKERVKSQIKIMRGDHLRYHNPTPYKVSVSDALFKFLHQLWLDSAPVLELS
ncbi:hypothetical protein TrST_g6198 [Triparma strigata]|uniref:Nicotinate phosphoribosyltransferase n=1 Tax=Triparma strigata TaxID=1606541 RepID=A0A9W7BDE5_9STRA|nr:hypothetical protein TrST_g6198 [Triparma strigata]